MMIKKKKKRVVPRYSPRLFVGRTRTATFTFVLMTVYYTEEANRHLATKGPARTLTHCYCSVHTRHLPRL